MAVMKFSLGQVNITQWLIINLRKTTAPGVIYASQSFAPPQPTTRNITFNNIDTGVYEVDFRESPDGIALGTLLSTENVNIKETIQVFERRFYTVDGGGPHDPASGQNILSDPYLDGKPIGGVFQEGFRFLEDPFDITGTPNPGKEYDLHTGGGVELLNGLQFSSPGQKWSVDIINSQEVPVVNIAVGGFGPVVDLTGDTTISSTHYNKRLRCESSASSRLIVTMPSLAATPEATAFLFMCNGGNQFQTKIVRTGSDLFKYHEFTPSEISFMKGESFIIEKRTINGVTYWEMYNIHAGLLTVLQRFDGQWNAHPNCKVADGSLYDGDDWPRPWYWIKNNLPVTHYIIDNAVTGGGYVHPAGQEGLYVIHSTLNKFRVPNTQGWSKRNLKSFTTFNTDTTRKIGANPFYDYPGGTQEEMIKDHFHDGLEADTASHGGASSALSGIFGWLVNTAFGSHGTARGGKTGSIGNGLNGTRQTVNNWGCVDLIRF